MSEDIGYINARIRGMKSYLLSEEKYEELLSKRNFSEFVEGMKDTSYKDFLPPSYPEPSLKELVDGVNSEVMSSLGRIMKFSSGEVGELISKVLQRFTLSNIRAIIRGKIRRIPNDEIKEAIFPIYPLDMPKIEELLKKETAFEVAEMLITWRIELPFPITRYVLKMIRNEELSETEYYLEKAFFENTLNKLGNSPDDKIILHILRSWIDMRNIIGSLLLLKYNIKPSGKIKYIEGGYISERIIKRLAESDNLEEGLKVISITPYKKIFSEGKIDISAFEKRFEESLTAWSVKGFLKDPLSIALPVAYIFSKYNELINLRIIVYAIDQEIPPVEIKKYLFQYERI